MSDQTLEEDVAIVTGAGQNIGQEIAETFAEEGANVVVADIDEDRALATVEAIHDNDGEAIAAPIDVSDQTDVKSMIDTTEKNFGPVDILVNNVAISDRDHFLDLDIETFDRVMRINLRGTFLCTQAAAQSMKKSGGGRIVNVASTSAHKGRANASAYATSKSGILNFTRSTAKALGDHNIRVNTLSPTRTGSRVGTESVRSGDVPDEILVGRYGKPQDQANAALFLVDPENSFITGIEILVDGGSSA